MSEMEKKICLGCMQEINADDVIVDLTRIITG